MKESDIINSIIYPLLTDAGYKQNEIRVDYAITSYASKDSSGIQLRPDIVLFDKQNNAILVIETKLYFSESNLEDTRNQAIRYSDALNLPLYAISDGRSFQLISKNKGEIYHTDSIVDNYNEITKVLNKENLRNYSLESRKDELEGVDIELEQEWIDQINKEIFNFNENVNEIRTLGAKAIGWLGERIFKKYCDLNGIPVIPVMLGYADFIVGQEKVIIKTIIEEEGKPQKRSVLQLRLTKSEESILILVVIRGKKDEDELLGYSFQQASLIGYIPINNSSSSLNNKYLLKRSDLLPMDNWRRIRMGEANL